jgi:ABC-type glycerol-3-phosphate transport system substrate-binding protein
VRRLFLLLLALALAGCGGSSKQPATANAAAPPGPGTTLYAGGDWAVVLDGDHATAFHRVAGSWNADTSGAVKIRILGPDGKVAPTPQVAAELSAGKPLIESGMWVDGHELLVKGGGLTATKGTIYGAPDTPLTKGTHVAVAYARTAEHATAVAWSFRVV